MKINLIKNPKCSPSHAAYELANVLQNKVKNHHATKSDVLMSKELINDSLNLQLKKPNIDHVNIKRINIESCKDFRHAVDYIKALELDKNLQESDDVILAKLHFEDGLNDFISSEMSELMELCKNKSVVILLVSKNFDKFSIYWKSKELDHFLITKPYDDQITKDDAELYDFIAEFLAEELKFGYLGKRIYILLR